MHQMAMDETRQAITSSFIFRRLKANVDKATKLQGLHQHKFFFTFALAVGGTFVEAI